jgi:hypothetical protein
MVAVVVFDVCASVSVTDVNDRMAIAASIYNTIVIFLGDLSMFLPLLVLVTGVMRADSGR